MSTYVQLRSRIADDLNRSDVNSQINQQIIAAIRHYRTYPFWFNEKATTFTGQAVFKALPSDFVADQGLYVCISGYEVELEKWAWRKIFDQRPSSGGRPGAYCIYQNRYEFNRSLDASYTFVARYIYELSEVTLSASDDQSNAWTTDCEDLIVYRAEKMLYSQLLHDTQNAQRSNELEREAFKALMRYRDTRQTPGYAQPYHA